MDRVETWLAIENVAGVDGVMVPRIAPPAPHRYWRTSSYVAPGETVAVAETGVAASEVNVVPVPDTAMIAEVPVLRSAITPRGGALTVSSHPTACSVAALMLAVPDRVAVTVVVDRAGTARGGAEAVRYLSRRLPLLWPLALPLHLPGSLPIWRSLYALVARNRYRIAGRCDDGSCRLPQATPDRSR